MTQMAQQANEYWDKEQQLSYAMQQVGEENTRRAHSCPGDVWGVAQGGKGSPRRDGR